MQLPRRQLDRQVNGTAHELFDYDQRRKQNCDGNVHSTIGTESDQGERYEARWREDQTKKEMSELDEIATRLGFCISQEDQKEERTGAELRN